MSNKINLLRRIFFCISFKVLNKYKIYFSVIFLISLPFYIIKFKFTNEIKEVSYLKLKEDGLNCTKLFERNPNKKDVESAKAWKFPPNESLSDVQLTNIIKKDCKSFLKDKQYILTTEDEEEKKFSIAFNMVAYKSAAQVERLLRMIYRPWNYYCIHVDLKANRDFFNAIEQLTKCLNENYSNIVNTKNRVDVKWGTMTVLIADLNCMKELYDRYKLWKYLINLTGQEFPLKTNKELVEILKAFKGANSVEGTYKRRNENRVPTVKMSFPLVWYKGSVHITVNRDFIKFIFESPNSKEILKAVENRMVPDEQFFSTLNFNVNLKIPGSYIGIPDDKYTGYVSRYKIWYSGCMSGYLVRSICIFGVEDFPKLIENKNLFANKFYEHFQPATLRCLEKLYYQKLYYEALTGKTQVDVDYYAYLPFITNQYKPTL